MDANAIPGLITGSLALVAAIASGFISNWFQNRRERSAHQRASGTPGAPTVQDIWLRQDKTERALKASLVLLAESIEQHANPGALRLSKSAIKTLRETEYLPPELEDVLTD
ncbi:hypothetical protein SEA_MERCEDES_24 [Microbacterium phage Mercedes]|nr:hypothetical protein SEA_MERCEDES_24 [Microbacterium phage Mercedes]